MIPSVLSGALAGIIGGGAAMGVDWARFNGRAWLAWVIGFAALAVLVAGIVIGGTEYIPKAAIAVGIFGILLYQRTKARNLVQDVAAQVEAERAPQ